MKKRKWFANVVKEEKWINDMLKKGYKCTNISTFGMYTFEMTDVPHVLHLDYHEYMSKEKFEEYKMIYEDFGWIHLKGSRFGSVQYWQKESDKQNEIFSDSHSQIAYFNRLKVYSSTFTVILLVYLITIFDGNLFSGLLNIKASYLTEGLWDMGGSEFWKAFLFETPFALLRFLPPWILLISAGMFVYANIEYEKQKRKLQ